MIRIRLAWLKPIVFALLAVLLLISSAEVGLRLHEASVQNRPAVDSVDSPLMMMSRRTHHALKPLQTVTVRHPDTGESIRLSINSFGLRGREVAVPKPPDVYRILCLGDETTLAPEIPERDTFCARLAELLQSRTRLGVEVFNAGVPGYCPLLSYLQVKHSLLALQPDLIILNFHMSDVADDYRCRRHAQITQDGIPVACPHPQLTRSQPVAANDWHDRFLVLRWYKRQLSQLATGQGHSQDPLAIDSPAGRFAWVTDDPPDWSIYIQQALSPIGELHKLAFGAYAEFLVATSPVPWQVSATASSGSGVRQRAGVPQNAVYRNRAPFRILAESLRRQGIPFCDTSTAFRGAEHPDRLFLHNAARLSREGHELYARELAAFVMENVSGIGSGDSFEPPDSLPPRHAFPPAEKRTF